MTKKNPTFTLFREDADPSYDIVNDFYKSAFGKDRSDLPKDQYENAQDQIIQGWVFLGWQPAPEKQKYLNYQTYMEGRKMAAIFIKGHSLQKIIYCLWDPKVVFYCPEVKDFTLLSDTRDKELAKAYNETSLDPESYQINRFYASEAFYYSDDLSKSWKKLTFENYSRLDENLFAAETLSTGHFIANINPHLI